MPIFLYLKWKKGNIHKEIYRFYLWKVSHDLLSINKYGEALYVLNTIEIKLSKKRGFVFLARKSNTIEIKRFH